MHDQQAVVIAQLPPQVAHCRRPGWPILREHRKAAADQVRVDAVGSVVDAEHAGGLPWGQRIHSWLAIGPPVELTIMSGDAFHHPDVGTDEDEEHREVLQVPVPAVLELRAGWRVALQEVRKLVDNDGQRLHRGGLLRGEPQRCIPGREGRALSESCDR